MVILLSYQTNFLLKFDESNFLIWKEKLRHVICVYELQGFIDGSSIATQKLIDKTMQVSYGIAMKNQDILEVNPEFDGWDIKDKIIISWIYNSITSNYLKYLSQIGKDSIVAYWKALEKVF